MLLPVNHDRPSAPEESGKEHSAATFASSTGLAELVESMLSNPFAANRLVQFR